jgi:hypothetical protein
MTDPSTVIVTKSFVSMGIYILTGIVWIVASIGKYFCKSKVRDQIKGNGGRQRYLCGGAVV